MVPGDEAYKIAIVRFHILGKKITYLDRRVDWGWASDRPKLEGYRVVLYAPDHATILEEYTIPDPRIGFGPESPRSGRSIGPIVGDDRDFYLVVPVYPALRFVDVYFPVGELAASADLGQELGQETPPPPPASAQGRITRLGIQGPGSEYGAPIAPTSADALIMLEGYRDREFGFKLGQAEGGGDAQEVQVLMPASEVRAKQVVGVWWSDPADMWQAARIAFRENLAIQLDYVPSRVQNGIIVRLRALARTTESH